MTALRAARPLLLALVGALGCCAPADREAEGYGLANDMPRIAPSVPSQPAPVSGYMFRGAERANWAPGWRGVILDGRIRLDSPTSAGWVSVGASIPRMEGNRRVYAVLGLTLAIEAGACAIPDYRPALPDRVTLEWDGGRFDGCGGSRTLPSQIDGTTWELVRIEYDPAPDGRAPAATLTFGPDGSLGGTLACNDAGIHTTWTADRRFVSAGIGVEQTAVGCNDPAVEAFGMRFWSGLIGAKRWSRVGEWLRITLADDSDAELRLIL